MLLNSCDTYPSGHLITRGRASQNPPFSEITADSAGWTIVPNTPGPQKTYSFPDVVAWEILSGILSDFVNSQGHQQGHLSSFLYPSAACWAGLLCLGHSPSSS